MLYHHTSTIKFDLPSGIKLLTYSKHAKLQSKSDRYGEIKLPVVLDVSKAQIVEIDYCPIHNIVTKFVLRKRYTNLLDLCFVTIPTEFESSYFVKTVWINERTDTHKTLDSKKYCQGGYRLSGRVFIELV